jgi:hypothetical protein
VAVSERKFLKDKRSTLLERLHHSQMLNRMAARELKAGRAWASLLGIQLSALDKIIADTPKRNPHVPAPTEVEVECETDVE